MIIAQTTYQLLKFIKYDTQNYPPQTAKINQNAVIASLRSALAQAQCAIDQLQTISTAAQFFPANDYRRIYIEVKAHAQIGQLFPAPYSSYSELADLLTPIVGWVVDENSLKSFFYRQAQKCTLNSDILRRAAQLK